MEMETKPCRKCLCIKPIIEFPITDRERGYRKGICKTCEAARGREYYATHEEYREKLKKRGRWQKRTATQARSDQLKYKYGLADRQYAELLAAQNGVCALCKSAEVGNGRWAGGHFHVDHDHGDGHVRGLLCQPCNTQLGGYETLVAKVGETALLDYLTRPCPVPPAPPPVLPVYERAIEAPPVRYGRKPREWGACQVDGCDKEEFAVGYCNMHYARLQRSGEVGPTGHIERVGVQGERHPKSKLTADDVRAIRASTERGARLAERYGVTRTLISNILSRKVWTHI
jgi:hypothetical protein